ncbi:MAG: hypothetical protein IKO78_02165 [Bacilli bacterium]|nr:hypothetical protein [Bacilli bacterium]
MSSEVEDKIFKYFMKYGSHYDENCTDFIVRNMEEYLRTGKPVDVISQVAYAIGERPEVGETRYDTFFEYLKQNGHLDKNILEVSCGRYPALADMIDKYQRRTGVGTIAAYDPCLVTTRLGNIKLYRDFFNHDTDISAYTLLTGLYPCHTTLNIIRKANAEDKDFVIGLCGCIHSFNEPKVRPEPTYEGWLGHLQEVAQRTVHDDREIVLEDVKGLKYPVISSRRKMK